MLVSTSIKGEDSKQTENNQLTQSYITLDSAIQEDYFPEAKEAAGL